MFSPQETGRNFRRPSMVWMYHCGWCRGKGGGQGPDAVAMGKTVGKPWDDLGTLKNTMVEFNMAMENGPCIDDLSLKNGKSGKMGQL